MTIRVFLADDHEMFRSAMRLLLESQGDIQVSGEVADGAAVVAQLPFTDVDVLLLDVSMPGMDGVEVMSRVQREQPGLKVIGLSGCSDRQTIVDMICAGVRGFVVKSAALDELFNAVRRVAAGECYLSGEITHLVVEELRTLHGQQIHPIARLGAREKQVLVQIAQGARSAEMAVSLGISLSTVETHRRNIMRKLDLHSAAALTRFARGVGLVRGE